jgi:hypothetical protein
VASALLFLPLLAACESSDSEKATDPNAVRQKAEWLQKFASEQPAKAERFSAECQKEVGFSMTKAGALAFIDCVQAKSKKSPS